MKYKCWFPDSVAPTDPNIDAPDEKEAAIELAKKFWGAHGYPRRTTVNTLHIESGLYFEMSVEAEDMPKFTATDTLRPPPEEIQETQEKTTSEVP